VATLRETLTRIKPSVAQIVFVLDNKVYPAGSGFIISADGYIATCSHVLHPEDIPQQAKLAVRFHTLADPQWASVIIDNVDTDIALLKVQRDDLVPMELGSYSDVEEGDDVAFCGYPLDIRVPTTHRGIVSAKGSYMRRDPESNAYLELLQIDASVNRGNSGGPLFLPHSGRVAGVVSSMIVASISGQPIKGMPWVEIRFGGRDYGKEIDDLRKEVKEALNSLQLGIGYAISVDYLKEDLRQLGR